MSPASPAATTTEEQERPFWRWVGPLAALLVFALVVAVLHREFAHLHIKSVFRHLHAIPRRQILAALGFTALSLSLIHI